VDLIPSKVPPDKTAVLVNGEPLSLEEFDTEFRLMAIHYGAVSGGRMRSIKRRLFEQVINRRLLIQEARKEGIRITRREWDGILADAMKEMPEDFLGLLKVQGVDEDAWKRKLFQEKWALKVVERAVNAGVTIAPKEVEEYYWSHLGDYREPRAVHALHFVVGEKADLEKALALLKKGETFPSVVSRYSLGPEKPQGGDWGFMAADRLPPSYLKALSALKPGKVSPPLQDDLGYHLFMLLEWRPSGMRGFAEVRQRIFESLLKEEQDSRFDEWMTVLKRKAVIRVNPLLAPVVGATLEELNHHE
jgi:parvulin-like peptidyl-prolyl isomerase